MQSKTFIFECEARLFFKHFGCKQCAKVLHNIHSGHCFASNHQGATQVNLLSIITCLAVQALCYSKLTGQSLNKEQHQSKAGMKKDYAVGFFFGCHFVTGAMHHNGVG